MAKKKRRGCRRPPEHAALRPRPAVFADRRLKRPDDARRRREEMGVDP